MGSDGAAHIVRAFSGPFVSGKKRLAVPRDKTFGHVPERTRRPLFASIRNGKANQRWRPDGHTAHCLAIMGRMAAYTGQEVTWEEAMNSQQSSRPEKLTWETPAPVVQVAMPGRTKVV